MGHNFYSISKNIASCIGNPISSRYQRTRRRSFMERYLVSLSLYGPYVSMFKSLVTQWACFLHNCLVSILVQIKFLAWSAHPTHIWRKTPIAPPHPHPPPPTSPPNQPHPHPRHFSLMISLVPSFVFTEFLMCSLKCNLDMKFEVVNVKLEV